MISGGERVVGAQARHRLAVDELARGEPDRHVVAGEDVDQAQVEGALGQPLVDLALLGAYQLNLLATLAGIGRAALNDVVEQVRSRTRNYSHANAPRVRDDAQVLGRIGDIAAAVYAAEAATIRVAASLEVVADQPTAHPEHVAAAVEVSEIESAAAQVVVTELVLKATSDLFDTLGASATARSEGLDRHWRNARTVSSHNPRILKSRVVGAYVVNGTPPPYAWAIGGTRRQQDWPRPS